jgi:hypothetical protein
MTVDRVVKAGEEPFEEVESTGRFDRYTDVLGLSYIKKVYHGFDQVEQIEVAWNRVRLGALADWDPAWSTASMRCGSRRATPAAPCELASTVAAPLELQCAEEARSVRCVWRGSWRAPSAPPICVGEERYEIVPLISGNGG